MQFDALHVDVFPSSYRYEPLNKYYDERFLNEWAGRIEQEKTNKWRAAAETSVSTEVTPKRMPNTYFDLRCSLQ